MTAANDGQHDSTPTILKRAVAYIDAHAQSDISVIDIAEAVYVTPRALQYMFRKHRACTPMEYVRRVRLHRAHIDLVAGESATTSVAEIGRRWGFGHLGRFATGYRRAYGESPRETLRS